MNPLMAPVKVPKSIMSGAMSSIASILWTNKKYAMISWAALWNSAPMILIPVALNTRGIDASASHMARVLAVPPPRLSRKEGPRKVPENREPRTTRISVTMTAG